MRVDDLRASLLGFNSRRLNSDVAKYFEALSLVLSTSSSYRNVQLLNKLEIGYLFSKPFQSIVTGTNVKLCLGGRFITIYFWIYAKHGF